MALVSSCYLHSEEKVWRVGKTVVEKLSGHEHMLRDAFHISVMLRGIIETVIEK